MIDSVFPLLKYQAKAKIKHERSSKNKKDLTKICDLLLRAKTVTDGRQGFLPTPNFSSFWFWKWNLFPEAGDFFLSSYLCKISLTTTTALGNFDSATANNLHPSTVTLLETKGTRCSIWRFSIIPKSLHLSSLFQNRLMELNKNKTIRYIEDVFLLYLNLRKLVIPSGTGKLQYQTA